MGNVNDDIEKYLKGELSPSEMHALEKNALRDPFLAEALEGATSITAQDFSSDVKDLNERVAGSQKNKTRWIIPLRIAASILLLLVVSYFIYTYVKPDSPVTLAQQVVKQTPAAIPKTIDTLSPAAASKEKTGKELLSLNTPPPEKKVQTEIVTSPATTASAPLEEREKVSSGQAALAEPESSVKPIETKSDQPVINQNEKVAKNDDKLKKAEGARALSYTVSPKNSSARRRAPMVVRGKVTAAEDGSPIPGANIQVQGTNIGTVSDANGDYQVHLNNDAQDSLVISFIGYKNKEVKVPGNDSELNVSLTSDVSQLSEVVVMDMNLDKDERQDDGSVYLADPRGGKKSYDNYLRENLHYPQQAIAQKIEGRVILEFTVEPSGDLTDFIIIRSLGFGCDEEVIRLVKEGPAWKPSVQDKAKIKSTIRVGVKFKLPN